MKVGRFDAVWVVLLCLLYVLSVSKHYLPLIFVVRGVCDDGDDGDEGRTSLAVEI